MGTNNDEAPSAPPVPPGTPPTQDERTWGMIAHLSAFSFFIVPPIGIVLGPLEIGRAHV